MLNICWMGTAVLCSGLISMGLSNSSASGIGHIGWGLNQIAEAIKKVQVNK